jgi:hypothetical protein
MIFKKIKIKRMLSESIQIIDKSPKIDNVYQTNSILSTASDPYLFKTQSLPISSLFQQYHKKVKILPMCYPCAADDCTMLFDKKEDCEKHTKIHENLIKCNYPGCNKQFIQFVNLKKHFKHHFPTKKIYFCSFPGCNKSFTASYNLTIHDRIHKGDRPYECEKCGKKFFDRANYKYHITVKHIEIKVKDRTCQHKGCYHKSKTIKQKLMHHDKLEIECKNEKNNLFNLLNNFRNSIKDLLGLDSDLIDDLNKYEGKDTMKEEIFNLKEQAKTLFEAAVDKDQYKGIVGNY